MRPAGDLAWVPAVQLGSAPIALPFPDPDAVPDADAVPGGRRSLVVSAVDATTAQLIWLDQAGGTDVEDLELENDTSRQVEVPAGAVAVWLRPLDPEDPGVVAAAHLTGKDSLGPYVSATSLPTVPWTRAITRIVPVRP